MSPSAFPSRRPANPKDREKAAKVATSINVDTRSAAGGKKVQKHTVLPSSSSDADMNVESDSISNVGSVEQVDVEDSCVAETWIKQTLQQAEVETEIVIMASHKCDEDVSKNDSLALEDNAFDVEVSLPGETFSDSVVQALKKEPTTSDSGVTDDNVVQEKSSISETFTDEVCDKSVEHIKEMDPLANEQDEDVEEDEYDLHSSSEQEIFVFTKLQPRIEEGRMSKFEVPPKPLERLPDRLEPEFEVTLKQIERLPNCLAQSKWPSKFEVVPPHIERLPKRISNFEVIPKAFERLPTCLSTFEVTNQSVERLPNCLSKFEVAPSLLERLPNCLSSFQATNEAIERWPNCLSKFEVTPTHPERFQNLSEPRGKSSSFSSLKAAAVLLEAAHNEVIEASNVQAARAIDAVFAGLVRNILAQISATSQHYIQSQAQYLHSQAAKALAWKKKAPIPVVAFGIPVFLCLMILWFSNKLNTDAKIGNPPPT